MPARPYLIDIRLHAIAAFLPANRRRKLSLFDSFLPDDFGPETLPAYLPAPFARRKLACPPPCKCVK